MRSSVTNTRYRTELTVAATRRTLHMKLSSVGMQIVPDEPLYPRAVAMSAPSPTDDRLPMFMCGTVRTKK